MSWQQHLQTFTKQLHTFRSFTQQFSSTSHDADQWLQMLTHFSTALHDRNKRQKMVAALGKLEQETKTSAPQGDMIYDLFHSPQMLPIVKQTLQKQRKF
jgi:hypothetical protein